jgi:hypothetical protein
VVTSFGLREIIKNQLAMGRIAKWALELMGLDVAYVPQTAINSQAWWTLWVNGPRPSNHPHRSLKKIGACTSMAPSSSTVPGEL